MLQMEYNIAPFRIGPNLCYLRTMESIPEIGNINGLLAEFGLAKTIVISKDRLRSEEYEEILKILAVSFNKIDSPDIGKGLEEALEELSGSDFFLLQNVFCDLIPRLEVEHRQLLLLVSRLVETGSNDLMAGQPNAALRNWCAIDIRRSHAIYAHARDGEPSALKHLTFALEAHHDVDEAVRFTDSEHYDAQLAAVTALGRMKIADADFGRVSEALVKLAERPF